MLNAETNDSPNLETLLDNSLTFVFFSLIPQPFLFLPLLVQWWWGQVGGRHTLWQQSPPALVYVDQNILSSPTYVWNRANASSHAKHFTSTPLAPISWHTVENWVVNTTLDLFPSITGGIPTAKRSRGSHISSNKTAIFFIFKTLNIASFLSFSLLPSQLLLGISNLLKRTCWTFSTFAGLDRVTQITESTQPWIWGTHCWYCSRGWFCPHPPCHIIRHFLICHPGVASKRCQTMNLSPPSSPKASRSREDWAEVQPPHWNLLCSVVQPHHPYFHTPSSQSCSWHGSFWDNRFRDISSGFLHYLLPINHSLLFPWLLHSGSSHPLHEYVFSESRSTFSFTSS